MRRPAGSRARHPRYALQDDLGEGDLQRGSERIRLRRSSFPPGPSFVGPPWLRPPGLVRPTPSTVKGASRLLRRGPSCRRRSYLAPARAPLDRGASGGPGTGFAAGASPRPSPNGQEVRHGAVHQIPCRAGTCGHRAAVAAPARRGHGSGPRSSAEGGAGERGDARRSPRGPLTPHPIAPRSPVHPMTSRPCDRRSESRQPRPARRSPRMVRSTVQSQPRAAALSRGVGRRTLPASGGRCTLDVWP